MAHTTSTLAVEIQRIRQRHEMHLEGGAEVPTTWEFLGDALCWHVILSDVIEPDIDLEVLPDAVLVRALINDAVRQAILPVPQPFRFEAAHVCLHSSTLEIRLHG